MTYTVIVTPNGFMKARQTEELYELEGVVTYRFGLYFCVVSAGDEEDAKVKAMNCLARNCDIEQAIGSVQEKETER